MTQPETPVPVQTNLPDAAAASTVSRTQLYIGIGIVVLAALGAVLYWFTPLFSGSPQRTEPLTVGIIQNVKHLDQVIEGFKLGLTELGYEEGVDIVYEYASVDGDMVRAKEVAADYVARDVDLMLVITTPLIPVALEATQEAGKSIPIIFTNGSAIVESGLADSYQSSGKNFTGVIPDDVDVTVKKLEFMKQIQPSAKKVGVFYSSALSSPVLSMTLQAVRDRAPALGLTLVEYDLKVGPPQSPAAMQRVADSINAGDIDAIITVPDVVSNYKENPKIQIELSKRIKAPVYFLTVPRVFEGGLLSYSQDYIVFGKQAAAQADRVFKGTNPKDIPLETSKQNLLIINLKTAREMGLTVPESLLFVANQVIPADAPAQ